MFLVAYLTGTTALRKPWPGGKQCCNEMSPFLAADGQTLYFASNGWPGYGGYDIYMTRRLDETWEHWTEPLNLGSGINTANWEAYFTTDAMGNMAYFCSSKVEITLICIVYHLALWLSLQTWYSLQERY